MESKTEAPISSPIECRRPSHSSPNTSAMSDSPFAPTCSISPLEPSDPRVAFLKSKGLPAPSYPSHQQKKNKFLPNLSARQWLIFAIFVGTNFLIGMVYNLKGPFYPQEAESKSVSPSSYGFVFGIFEFTKVFASPLYGKYMNQLGARRVFLGSLYIIGLSSIFFGLLDEISDSTWFLVCSLTLRVVEAIGSAGYSCALFSIIAKEFPGSVAATFAVLEACFGLGLIVAPPLGGVLYQLAGYPLPFIAIGLLIFTSVNFICVIMPRSFTVRDAEGRPTEGIGILKILTIPGVAFSAAGTFTAACTAGFINATLEPHLRQFNLSPFQTGVVYAIFGLVYAVSAPGFGWICDRVREPKFITLFGATSNFIAFLLMGPAPIFNFDTILWVTCIALVLHGLALGAMFVSLFILAFTYAVKSGMPNDMKTHAVVSGMWTSVLSMGMFVASPIGGILIDHFGFRWGSLFVLSCMAFLIILVVIYIVFQKSMLRPSSGELPAPVNSSEETEPLIFSTPLPKSPQISGQSGFQSDDVQSKSSYGAV